MSGFWSTIEAKVKSAAFATLVASVFTALLNALVGNSHLLGSLPPWLQFVIVTAVPPLLTFIAGYAAHHTAIAPMKDVK